jgi:hypothetical protein
MVLLARFKVFIVKVKLEPAVTKLEVDVIDVNVGGGSYG